ncbi:hypothetical protein [Corynebacterium mayonis]|uniref:hypothetical protein n=1 Tax=Corynebacterium mayonis TaxID=3062461 RepID=UPI0031402CB0
MIPVQMRAGGAFVALAIVLFIFAATSFFRGQPVFSVTSQVACVLVAAVLFGANATFVRGQERTRGQVVSLAGAVALVAVGAVLPAQTLFVTQLHWLILWALTAVFCALILRRFAS